MAAIQFNVYPERGSSRAHWQRDSWRATLAAATQKRKHAAQACASKRILFRHRGDRADPGWQRDHNIPPLGGVFFGPSVLRQIFNDSDSEVLWLIVGAPEKEFEPDEVGNMSLTYPVEPTQLPPELEGAAWPPKT